MPLTTNWFKCYGDGWTGVITPESFCHPAKFSRALIRRIYAHAVEEGWVEANSVVVDPFGGVALGGLEAMRRGLHWVGVELEPRFVLLGQGGDCDGTVEIETRLVHIKVEPGCKGWFVRLRAEAKYWGKSCKVCDGGPIGEGFETKQQASAFVDELATSEARWERTAYTIHYYKDEPIAAHDEWQQFVTRPALCGRQEAHEPHHVVGNIELWNKRYAEQMPNWGSAVIVQGDSRRLGEVLALVSVGCRMLAVYKEAMRKNEAGNLPDTGFEAALAVASPVYIGNTASDDPDKRGGLYRDPKRRNDKTLTATYSKDAAQLAQMPEGDLVAVISSPPFVGSIHEGGHGIDAEKLAGNKAGPNSQALIMDGYGREPGQLAALPEGDHAEALRPPAFFHDMESLITALDGTPGGLLDGDGDAEALEAGAATGRAQACISSPPFEGVVPVQDKTFWLNDGRKVPPQGQEGYGESAGQLGQETGPTFWAASRTILEQVYQVLAPGGHAIFVCKRFVRNKAIVDFPTQWAHLCEAVGFTWIHHHKAWLVEDRGAQHTLEGGLDVRQVKRMSFFRRLHAAKYPHLEILYEDVLCFVKEPQ